MSVYLQHYGQCHNCKAWGTLEQETVTPTSAAAGEPSAKAYADKLLRQGRSSSSSSSRYTPPAAAAAAAGGGGSYNDSYNDDSFAEAAADPFNHIGPDYDSDFGEGDIDDGTSLFDAGGRVRQQRLSSASGTWVQPQGRGHAPVRLSDLQFEEKELRLPLFGATGEEVSACIFVGCAKGGCGR